MDLYGRCRRWNINGLGILFVLGTLNHFLYAWSGRNALVGAFVPVNESVWEHGKLLLWPISLWWLLGMALIRPMRAAWPQGTASDGRLRWLMGAGVSCMTALGVMIAGFYTITGAFGLHALWADILLFALALVAGQAAGLRVFSTRARRRTLYLAPAIALSLLLLASIVFTYKAPNIPLFTPPAAQTGVSEAGA